MAETCAGCEARDREIVYLRERIEKLEDRTLELLSPGVTRREQVQNVQAEDQLFVEQIEDGPDGKKYVKVPDGRRVDFDVWLLVKKQGGGISETGQYVSPAEYAAGMAKIAEMQAGG